MIQKNWPSAFIAIFFIAIYWPTMARYIMEIDNGELLSAQYHWGVTHATGYPIFTFLGFLFSQIPLFERPLEQLNFLSLLYTVAGLIVFYNNSFLLFGKWFKQFNTIHIQIAGLLATLILGLSSIIWQQANYSEVYSLHFLLLNFIIYTLIKFNDEALTKNGVLIAFALALSFSNHLSTVMILPGVILITFNGFKKNPSIIVSTLLSGFGIGLLVILFSYGLMVYTAGTNPLINWGNPVTWDSFMYHISGKQYSNFIGGKGAFRKQMGAFMELLKANPSLLLGMVFSVYFFLSSSIQRLFKWFVVLSFISCLAIAGNYIIPDIENYFLLAILVLCISIGAGILAFAESILKGKLSFALSLQIVLGLGLSAWLLAVNYQRMNKSDLNYYEDYSRQIVKNLPKNAVLISSQWDILVAPSLYLQSVENLRRDVLVADYELFRRSWYFNQINNFDSSFLSSSKPEIENFLTALKPFERGQKFDGSAIEQRWRAMWTKLILSNYTQRPVFFTSDVIAKTFQNGSIQLPPNDSLMLIPRGLVYELCTSKDIEKGIIPIEMIEFKRGVAKNKYEVLVKNALSAGYRNQYSYFISVGDSSKAGSFLAISDSIAALK